MDAGGTSYLSALKATLRQTAAAYGYALTIASTSALLVSTQSVPSAGDVFLFALGGLAAFALLDAILELSRAGRQGEASDVAFPFAGALNFFSVFTALGAVDALVHAVTAGIVWLVAPALATAVYLAIVAVQVSVAERIRRIRGR
ncbi:MAG TPA: hypothetical protein VFN82_02840 [Solirubrobacterales bacterium]|nr:hypothetical protein [Solirubrobacterales bacterium]